MAKSTWFRIASLILLLIPSAMYADSFTTISMPTTDYLSATTKLNITDPNYTKLASLSDGVLSVGFSSPVTVMTAPDTWSYWGYNPFVESSDATVLWAGTGIDWSQWPYTPTAENLTFTLAGTVTTFGFEVMPDDAASHNYTVSFYDGTTLVGSINQSVDGSDTARLFAASTDGSFTSVTISSDSDFAIANLRYVDPPQGMPEPGTFGLLASGLGLLALRRRRN